MDATGTFPRDAVAALGEAGIFALTVSDGVGGGGQGLRQGADVVQHLACVCGSTAMVVLMHYAAAVVIDNHGPADVRKAIASGRHLTILAFSEVGSRSHFWAPQGTATAAGTSVRLDAHKSDAHKSDAHKSDAHKSWVTSAGQADSYVWSSQPMAANGPMTLWLVPTDDAVVGPHRRRGDSASPGASTASASEATAPCPSTPPASPSTTTPCWAPMGQASTSRWPKYSPGSW